MNTSIEVIAVLEDRKDLKIPVMDVSISIQADQPATASIVMLPTIEATEIPARTKVSLFFRYIGFNNFYEDNTPVWYLLFIGELTSDAVSYDTRGGTVNWFLTDLSSYMYDVNIKFLPTLMSISATIDQQLDNNPNLKIMSYYVATTKTMDVMSNLLNSLDGAFSTITNGFVQGLGSIINESHPFYVEMNKRRKVNNLFTSPHDNILLKLYLNLEKSISEISKGYAMLSEQNPMMMSFADLIYSYLKSIGYSIYPNPIATILNYSNNNTVDPIENLPILNSQMVLPDFFTAPPPRCNVIFPSNLTGFYLPRNKIVTTRYAAFHKHPAEATMAMGITSYKVAGWPIVDKDKGVILSDYLHLGDNARVWNNGDNFAMEYFGGPKIKADVFDQNSPESILMNMHNKEDAENSRNSSERGSAQSVAGYFAALSRYGDRIGQVQTIFNPNLVAGFPTLIIIPKQRGSSMEVMPYMGVIKQIHHKITPNGSTTSVVVANCHIVNEDLSRGVTDTDEARASSRYIPQVVEGNTWGFFNKTYKDLLGIPWVLANEDAGPSTTLDYQDIVVELKKLANDSLNWPDIKQVAFTRRKVATLEEVMDFFGPSVLSSVSDDKKTLSRNINEAFKERDYRIERLFSSYKSRVHL